MYSRSVEAKIVDGIMFICPDCGGVNVRENTLSYDKHAPRPTSADTMECDYCCNGPYYVFMGTN